MGDDKGDYEANPVRTHLPRAPSEERALPERRQVLRGYEQGVEKSNWRVADALGAVELELPGTLHAKVSGPDFVGESHLAERGIESKGPIRDGQEQTMIR